MKEILCLFCGKVSVLLLILQTSRRGRDNWLLFFNCFLRMCVSFSIFVESSLPLSIVCEHRDKYFHVAVSFRCHTNLLL